MKSIPNKLMTVGQFVKSCEGSWPHSEGTVRALILHANKNKNNFQSAFKKVGRRVLVDPNEFWACVSRI